MFRLPIKWGPDEQGTLSYNILGGLECMLINLGICDRVSETWNVDDMERFGFKFSIRKV